ncbi:bifunctional diguanylate cyclase/phosphodiesterase [uncultured Tateyamaria sp.]|uniref:putative bifunctional diguanylate cyclase/phosphodiesterase n=1 Tax=uncultured Tateyamaria sp. TaxID=455651 RepID=UPI00263834FE|nr:bifunctional diguanylate cyclase/phosphodiesterase [uncultured Tateyamaria sp.]
MSPYVPTKHQDERLLSTKDALCDAIDLASLRLIVDTLPHPAAVLQGVGQISHENRAFRSLRDRAFPAIAPDDFLETLKPFDRAKVEQMARDVTGLRPGRYQLDWQLPGALVTTHSADLTRLTYDGAFAGILCQMTPDQCAQSPTLRYLMENLDQGVWDYNLQTGAFVASKAWRKLRGWSEDHVIDMSNDNWLAQVHPEDRARLREAFDDQRDGGAKSIVIQYRHLHDEGHWVWILCRASVVETDSSGRPVQIVGTDTDISEAMHSQEAINQLAGKLKLAVEASGMGIWEFNPETRKVHWDDRMLEIYGISDGSNVRSDNLWETHLHPDDYEATVAYARECQRLNTDFKRDYRIVRPGGTVRHIRSLARTVTAPNGPTKLIGVNFDVTEDYRRAEELEVARAKLEHDALHDELTGLGNRRGLDQAAAELFNRISGDSCYAAMHIDLDHFKKVNDTLGHPAGDFVLSQVSDILVDTIGTMGQPFRVGGDEFAVLFEDAPDKDVLNAMCDQLIEAISAPMSFQGQPCSVGASIGYAIGHGQPRSQSSIFIEADTALYAAKRAGRFCYRAYSEEVGAEFHLVSNTRQDLKAALNADQIVCFFQPQYDAETLEIVGAEALVRWQCPKRGLLAPAQFLPNAIDAGLLDAIDRCVFQRVATLQTEWTDLGLSFPRISVNISRARLEDEALLEQTRADLRDHHEIAFELLETTFYDTPSTALLYKLDAIREMGIRIEMDDFGTGHASVKALQALQPDAVKIDRSLVTYLGTHAKQLEILQSLSRIARLEGADVVVEGLETGTHMAAIRKLDCDVLQGYVLQRPMAELEFAALLKANCKAEVPRTG